MPSCEPVMASGETCKVTTHETEHFRFLTTFVLSILQILRVSFLEPDKAHFPSAVIATHSGCVWWWIIWSLGTGSWTSWSLPVLLHSFRFLSFDTEIIVWQFFAMATEDTQEECPRRVCKHSPQSGSQTFSMSSLEADTTKLSSRDMARLHMASVWPRQKRIKTSL